MEKILVVDDCQDFREVLHDLLADAGYEVSVVENGDEALAACQREKYDLVVCDLVLPVLDDEAGEGNESAMAGVQTIQSLSRQYPKTPIIAVSGQMTGSPLEIVKKFGAVSCLSKPFGRDELLGAVKKALGR